MNYLYSLISSRERIVKNHLLQLYHKFEQVFINFAVKCYKLIIALRLHVDTYLKK